jgi:hypothetical protein
MERKTAETTIRAHYGEVAPTMVGGLVELLGLIRHEFDGDLDRWLVFATVVLRTVSAPSFRSIPLARFIDGELPPESACATNARSIAESLQIPRETVRRKVNELLAQGLIQRTSAGLTLSAQGAQDMKPLRDAIISLAARYYKAICVLKDRPGLDEPSVVPPVFV